MTPNQNTLLADCFIERAGGMLLRKKGVYIVHLRGDYETMGRQHGELAAAVAGDVVPLYMSGLLEKTIAHAIPAGAGLCAGLLGRWFLRRNRREIGTDMMRHLGALARAFNMPRTQAERLFLMPDIVHYLAGRSFAMLAPPPSCSGFFAHAGATKDGKLIIGRNLDFFGRGVWNSNNAIIVLHPRDGQRICWLGALGVTGSGQGLNESGLFIGMHSKFTRDVSAKGMPIFRIGHEILARCGNLEEAVGLILAHPRMCGLSFFVVDTRARTAAVVGFSARHAERIDPENDVLVRANHYVSPEMQRWEARLHSAMENTNARFQRLSELLQEKHGNLVVEDAPVILSDCIDPYEGRKRVVGSIVAATHNAQSLVISPDDDALWVAHGDFPVCHAATFLGFRISALWKDDLSLLERPDLAGGGQLTPAEQAALQEYEEAWSARADALDNSRAVFHLLRAAALLPEEPIFTRMAGLILLREGKYDHALPLLIRNADYDYRNPLTSAEALVWAGRCLDLLDRRNEAVPYYQRAAGLNVAPVSTAAARHCRKRFRAWQLLNMSPELIMGAALAKF